MAIKYTLQGLLVYAAMGCYLAGFVAMLLKRRRAGLAGGWAGSVIAAIAVAYRWEHTGHVPFQNLFEVFLAMGAVMAPLAWFCRRHLQVGGETLDLLAGILILFPAAFVFSAEPQKLPPALQSWLFAPHVGVYLLAYVIMAKATCQALAQLWRGDRPMAEPDLCDYETATYRTVSLGFPFLTLGLILGSWWGKLAWGDYWGWDPKEMWSLASWLAYIIYLHCRYMFGRKYPRLNSVWVLLGMALVVITLLWANLSRLFQGLHSYAS